MMKPAISREARREIRKSRALFLSAIGGAYPFPKMRKTVFASVQNPFFPMTYFVRNILMLRKESAWQMLTPRMQKTWITRLFWERCTVFMQTRHWLLTSNIEPPALSVLGLAKPLVDSYCIHCGGCCEIASGFPQFAEEHPVPHSWKDLFAQGLGRWHRFCAFLWEVADTGASVCAIHPWRPLPCRLFEEEECQVLRRDADFAWLSNAENARKTYSWFLKVLKSHRSGHARRSK